MQMDYEPLTYAAIFQETNIAGGYLGRYYIHHGSFPFVLGEYETLETLWSRFEFALQFPKTENSWVEHTAAPPSIDALLLNGILGGRKLEKIICVTLNEDRVPTSYHIWELSNACIRKNPLL